MRPYLDPDEIRDRFSKAMSDMYQLEVPQYGTLLKLVDAVNRETLDRDPDLHARLCYQQELARLRVERHGAIRVGTAKELATLRRLFAVMGMFPVGYYDLSEAGVPVHATAFRPMDDAALKRNPFRLFTSLLRLELIEDQALRARASDILEKRQIFTERALELITIFEQQGGLTDTEADQFVSEALETFRWHQQATVDHATYQALAQEHRLIADVVCFKGPHINHLTPRTLDIDEVQRRMPDVGITPKDVIEGPPRRQWPILLRQTSFKALEESIDFADHHDGTHTARFGEIEQRGVALTPKGRALYDRLLRTARTRTEGLANEAHQQVLAEVFEAFPDDVDTLHREGLAYFDYHLRDRAGLSGPVNSDTLKALIEQNIVRAEPITYEDFLPVSAAGIFQSNLGGRSDHSYEGNANQAAFEAALGAEVTSELDLYARREQASIDRLRTELTG
ncbi:2-oxoadipate dioxygenase/decarboxylase HglS [Larsenimonas rhizosphaerae]|uniref:2-oxoadipate dioxygenase/decarboxylase n=1 Tax=Larsenimonas rhizosphaerae TaxID=2944682 RepID=A0AA41ZF95_9GAMM|nr:VOC family protein [Larsenimonas rhizosphaerae]MCX2524207.1 VOC family protein [Larsenimonas rhizosphaerae]